MSGGQDELLLLLRSLNLDGVVKQVTGNESLAVAVVQSLTASGRRSDEIDKVIGAMLCAVATGLPDASRSQHRDIVSRAIGSGLLTTPGQVTAACDFFRKRPADAAYSATDFEAACGAGVKFSDEQITAKVCIFAGKRGNHAIAAWAKAAWALNTRKRDKQRPTVVLFTPSYAGC